ncbi:hypothetical protein BDB01DRAFT_356494 [Pilobolus umbonatus]|nr:hypothetical protein BDB01DRAFT_356494 [Pilobolus umbonatus]
MSFLLTNLALRPNPGAAFFIRNIHHYEVYFSAGYAPQAVIQKAWKTFEDSSGKDLFGNTKVVFDGRKNVFSLKQLPINNNDGKFFVYLEGKDTGNSCLRPYNRIRINITKVGEFDMEQLQRFLNKESASTPNCLSAIMIMDILIRHHPFIDYINVGGSFCAPNGMDQLSNGPAVFQGFRPSARSIVGKVMTDIDGNCAPLRNPGTLPEIITKILGLRSIDELRHGMSQRDINKLGKILKAVRIQVVDRSENRLKCRIVKLTPCSAARIMYYDKAGNRKSLVDFFYRRYNRRLAYPFLPCISVEKSYLFSHGGL